MFHKEGGKIILISTTIAVAILLLSNQYIDNFWLKKGLQVFAIIMLLMVLQFFRNPKRIVDMNEAHIIAPVDGKVVVIEEVYEGEYFKENRLQVSIFMSPINVHVTRYPISGLVKFSKYHPGKFLVAWHPKSSTENERTTTVVRMKDGRKILVRQIAGLIARRIITYMKPGAAVKQNDVLGFIKFGSRVDVLIPKD